VSGRDDDDGGGGGGGGGGGEDRRWSRSAASSFVVRRLCTIYCTSVYITSFYLLCPTRLP
jgi:hypothetical protein